jgi:hypothetical protein
VARGLGSRAPLHLAPFNPYWAPSRMAYGVGSRYKKSFFEGLFIFFFKKVKIEKFHKGILHQNTPRKKFGEHHKIEYCYTSDLFVFV